MRQPELITSPANPLLKEVRKAISRGGLTANGLCVAETFNLLEEALRSHCRVRAVIVGESTRASVLGCIEDAYNGDRNDLRVVVVPDKLLDAASQGVVALVDPPQVKQRVDEPPIIVIVDGVQDPGNLGTIIRSAEAFGASGLLLLKGTVNAFNPKVIRASAGSIFRMHFVQGLDGAQVAATLRESGGDLYAAVPNSPNLLADADLTRSCAFVIGSEGNGVSATLRASAKDLSIPTIAVESLNAAVSAAVLLYEARRQRSRTA